MLSLSSSGSAKKSRAELRAWELARNHGLELVVVRPGPIVGGAVTPFVERRTNPHFEPFYDHPRLEPILKDSLGVILYEALTGQPPFAGPTAQMVLMRKVSERPSTIRQQRPEVPPQLEAVVMRAKQLPRNKAFLLMFWSIEFVFSCFKCGSKR